MPLSHFEQCHPVEGFGWGGAGGGGGCLVGKGGRAEVVCCCQKLDTVF